jgi:hypothetical protein
MLSYVQATHKKTGVSDLDESNGGQGRNPLCISTTWISVGEICFQNSLVDAGRGHALAAVPLQLGDLSPFLLLDRKLHFGDVVAWVHVLRMLEMNVAG